MHWWSDRPCGGRSCASQYSSPIFERNWSRIFCPRVGILTNLRRLNPWHSWRGLRWLKSPVIIIPAEGLSISKLSKRSVMWSINSLSSVHVFPKDKALRPWGYWWTSKYCIESIQYEGAHWVLATWRKQTNKFASSGQPSWKLSQSQVSIFKLAQLLDNRKKRDQDENFTEDLRILNYNLGETQRLRWAEKTEII